MHIETLKVFCDIVETRSFSSAAARNFVTQSAVSQQIRMLEQRYGQKLLERTRGNVQVTPAGDILYQASKDIVERWEDMDGRLQAVTNVVAGAIRLATVHSIGLYELSAPLKRFLTDFPEVNLNLEYSRSSKIYEDALKSNIDLGIVAYATKRPGLVVIPYRQDRLALVVPPGHALAKQKRVSLRKLKAEAFVGFERDIPTRKETDRLLRKYDVDPTYVMELDNIETIKRVVEIGRAVAILPEPAVTSEVASGALAVVQIADETSLRPLGILHRQGKHFSPAMERFVAYLREG